MVTDSWRNVLAMLYLGLVGLAGCNSPVYNQHQSRSPAASITPQKQWRITGDLQDLARAIDGDVNTIAVTSGSAAGATLTLDLGKVCVFNMVVVDHGPKEFGFARAVTVLTSMDGKHFARRYAAPGTRRVSIFCIATPLMARYVRLQVTRPGREPWAVADVYLQ